MDDDDRGERPDPEDRPEVMPVAPRAFDFDELGAHGVQVLQIEGRIDPSQYPTVDVLVRVFEPAMLPSDDAAGLDDATDALGLDEPSPAVPEPASVLVAARLRVGFELRDD